ncbi:hypothetical protein JHK86_024794 [Glycine max]|nr:hypothetical protein JHK86_024794 [Glycine max]
MQDDVKEREVAVVGVERERESEAIVVSSSLRELLGHFQPQQGNSALWEVDSDQHYTIKKHGLYVVDDNVR